MVNNRVKNICSHLAAVVIVAAAYPAAVNAEETPWSAELFVGTYSSEISRLDEQELFGARIGYRFQEHFGMHVNLSARVGEIEAEESNATIDWRATAVDLSFVWHPKTGGRFEPSLYAGPGFASVSGELSREVNGAVVTVDTDSDLIDDTATLHVGIGSAIHLTDQIHLRIGTRARWYEARDSDEIDTEATLAIGFKFGQP